MTPLKRLFDILLALVLTVLLVPVMAMIAVAILSRDGRPVFFSSTRAKYPGQTFRLYKFRTMQTDRQDRGVSGGDKTHRITRTGRILRRYRLDELPQLVNIIKGDMSFVGPRPPLPVYVERFPDLYGKVLECRPGITGLATLAFHRTEERLLAACSTPDETDEVYIRRCIPVKARLDLTYRAHRNLCWDILLVLATVFRRIPLRLKSGSGFSPEGERKHT